MYVYRGNLHIHSTYSDGTQPVERIALAAAQAGLDFIVLTDHNTFQPLRDGHQGWRDGVLVLFGEEINHLNNHYLGFGLTEEVEPDDKNPQRVIDDVTAKGGFGFIAHPDDVGTPLDSGGHSYTWTDWTVQGYTGIEVWNFTSHWKAPVQSLLTGFWHYFVDRDGFVGTPPADTVARWRKACQSRRTVAIGTSDAHGLAVRAGPLGFNIFPYEYLFRRITMCLWTPKQLTGDVQSDRELLFDALRQGHCYICDRGAGDPSSFAMAARGSRATAIPGDEIAYEPGLELTLNVPEPSEIRIFKDGQLAHRARGRHLEWPLPGPGVYDAQIVKPYRILRERTWILTNPVYVRG